MEAEIRDGEVCVRTTYSGAGGTSSCIVDDDATALTTHGTSAGTGLQIVHGLTRADVASVRIELREGAVEVSTVEVQAIQPAPNSKRGFALAVPEFAMIEAITALDAANNVLERIETGM